MGRNSGRLAMRGVFLHLGSGDVGGGFDKVRKPGRYVGRTPSTCQIWNTVPQTNVIQSKTREAHTWMRFASLREKSRILESRISERTFL